MRPWPTDRVAFGGDYNPEQWPREVWADDLRLMAEAGVSFVTLGVFSWSWLEPSKGEYDFAWLDEIMDTMADHGIAVDLATATATPPPWLTTAYPEILPVDREGRRLWPGSRQSWCPSSRLYRDLALTLTDRIAARYHDHPALAMWHVSNEYACHNLPCYCDTCAVEFRRWLQRRYDDLEPLNEAWGTAFWSQRYSDWDEILPPRISTTFNNPTHVLDYARFGSDTLLDFFRAEAEVIRRHSTSVPITTNFMTMSQFRMLDYHAWAAEQDVVSTDHYVVDSLAHPRSELSFHGDLTRGLAGGRPWMLMEHSTSAVNWQPVNLAKPPGGTLRDSLTHVARGADALGFFQWRQSRAGSEAFHSAMVPHAGPDSDRFREVCELGAVAGRLGEVVGSTVEAEVAILWDYQALWALSGPCLPSARVDYPDAAHTVHRLLRERGITCDVVHPGDDLSRYRVVVVPTLFLVSDEHAAAVEAAARAGAHVVVTYLSGIVTPELHIRLGGYPGAFRDLLGVRVEELFPLPTDGRVDLRDAAGATVGEGRVWTEDARTVAPDCEAVLEYGSGPLAGRVAATRRPVGDGVTWYVGTLPDDTTLGSVLDRVVEEAGVRAVATVPSGVEVVRRRAGERSWLFVLNHTGADCELAASGHDLVADVTVGPVLTVAAGSAAVVREG
ncbi:beta-galactosidase [Nostocoides sp. Soil756]|jgi:beta-galactosidase|uniref:beta-galactosidase n=1 Tax=Nostocoides sp. Soil756 TaxID=1736399 RepID=UPI0007010087|nr:beta-galactosidase [Tetrasphaera sp. Soil756]KRE60669.1 beta-galactosidase [Tetrasphaera sp. Soil756]